MLQGCAALQMFWAGFLPEQGWEIYLALGWVMSQLLCLGKGVETPLHGTGCQTFCLSVDGLSSLQVILPFC